MLLSAGQYTDKRLAVSIGPDQNPAICAACLMHTWEYAAVLSVSVHRRGRLQILTFRLKAAILWKIKKP